MLDDLGWEAVAAVADRHRACYGAIPRRANPSTGQSPVPTNRDALGAFRYHVLVLWMRTLTRRSQKDRTIWSRVNRLADQWLPKPRILHPWPNQRFAVTHPRWEPDAGMPHVRFCAGVLSNGHPYRDPCAGFVERMIDSPPLSSVSRSGFHEAVVVG
jgi:hypothetical protein